MIFQASRFLLFSKRAEGYGGKVLHWLTHFGQAILNSLWMQRQHPAWLLNPLVAGTEHEWAFEHVIKWLLLLPTHCPEVQSNTEIELIPATLLAILHKIASRSQKPRVSEEYTSFVFHSELDKLHGTNISGSVRNIHTAALNFVHTPVILHLNIVSNNYKLGRKHC